ncbi:MAG: ABC transporter substrate-binding protein [Clostridiales Family XIII bacterium]|jgi:polar amino acid transport system substrate-binding protein|nr:ABC transporter substrate-binding protein [Clostridiales Family XIII bacterium]
MKKRTKTIAALLLAFALAFALAACGGGASEESAPAEEEPAAEEGADAAQTEDPVADTTSGADELQTITPGKLTVATGDPAWAPWVLNDDPASGEGYEAALVYKIADQLGFAPEDVVWTRSDFDAAIQPGPKDFDFNLQQYSITPERKEVVDFSSPYYKEPLVIVVKDDNPFAGATTLAELKGAVFGAASGDIATQVTEEKIAPDKEVQLFENLSDVFAALNSGQIDATICGLLTGDYVINIENEQVDGGIILGSVDGSEDSTEGLGLLLEKDSPLTPKVTESVDALRDDGTLDQLKGEWLSNLEFPVLK